MRTTAFILCLLVSAACDSRVEKARDISDELVYFKDHRTDLCFAYWSNGGSDRRDGMMTVVPCEQVAHLLVNGAERP